MSRAFDKILDKSIEKGFTIPEHRYKVGKRHEDAPWADIHEKQDELIHLRRTCLIEDLWSCCHAGRGGGKTEAIAKMVVDTMTNGKMGVVGIAAPEKDIAIDRFYDLIIDEIKKRKIPIKEKSKAKGVIEVGVKYGQLLFFGCKDKKEAEKPRGKRYKLFILEETQSFNRFLLKQLTENVVEPAFQGVDGHGVAIGTPPPIWKGWWHELIMETRREGKNYHFKAEDNIFFPLDSVEKHRDKIRKRRGLIKGQEDAAFIREYYGIPQKDTTNLCFVYDEKINDYDKIDIPVEDREYIIAADFGALPDKDALVVLCFSLHHPTCYLVDEYAGNNTTIEALRDKIVGFANKYNVTHPIIADAGALGKRIKQELCNRFGLDVIPAEKTEKALHITIMADALKSGRLKAKKESQCVTEMELVEWDEDKKGFSKKGYHSDLLDAKLYGYRYCLNWINEEKPLKIEKTEQEIIIEQSLPGDREKEIYDKYYSHDREY